MRELLFAFAIIVTSSGVVVQRDGVRIAAITPRQSTLPHDGVKEERASYSHITRGEFLGTIRIHKAFRDYRGNEIPPGTYALRYGVQPLMKDHAGTSKWRDFAIVEPDAPRDGHPWVLALVPPQETTTVISIGGQRFGFAFDEVVVSAF
jgi:hypothetical protein